MIYILHHNDTDGYAAAASFKYFHELFLHDVDSGKQVPENLKYHNTDEVEYHAVDYGMPLPEMKDGSIVYILDFSIPEQVIFNLIGRMIKVQIYDHHKSALDKIGQKPYAFFDMTRSGATIAWDMFSELYGYDTARTDFIRYVEDQDLGKYELPNSRNVKNYLYSIPLTVEEYYARLFLPFTDMNGYGEIISRYVKTTVENALSMAHIITLDTYKMLALSSCVMFDDLGSALKEKARELGCDICGTYYRYNQEMIKFSLRKVGDVKANEVAERFGGGGHIGAAGFMVNVSDFNGYRTTVGESSFD